jgi:hypothetical protein
MNWKQIPFCAEAFFYFGVDGGITKISSWLFTGKLIVSIDKMFDVVTLPEVGSDAAVRGGSTLIVPLTFLISTLSA